MKSTSERVVSRLGLALLLALVLQGLAGAAEFEFDALVRTQPALQEIAAAARRTGATCGIYGGTVRDLYLGRPFSVISDFDLVYDSSEAAFPALREEVLAIAKRYGKRIPTPDFHFDLSPRAKVSERQEQFHSEGVTATKVAVLTDGRVLDPTGLGCRDLKARVFRFHAPVPRRRLELHNLGRFVRDWVRLEDFTRVPSTVALFRYSLERLADPSTPEGRKVAASVAQCREQAAWTGVSAGGPGWRAGGERGLPVTFQALLSPFRRDVRYLHDGQEEKLTPCFPADLFLMDLFKSVTQASDLTAMRRAFAQAGVDRFLRRVGLEFEAFALMEPSFSREQLFRMFQFPGHFARDPRKPTAVEGWRDALQRFNYRVLFDMLASEFPAGSAEKRVLDERRDAFLSPGAYGFISPGDEYREELLGALDGEMNVGRLPREKLERSLEWFLTTYLPLGMRTLVELSPAGPGAVPAVRRGFSSELARLDREAPHSMAGLREYVEFQLGRELMPRMLDRSVTLAFLDCGEEEARRAVEARGFARVYRVNACGFSRRIRTLLAWDAARDKVCLVFHGFHCDEELLNQQARFCFAGGAGAGRVGSERVLVARRDVREAGRFPERAELERFAAACGRPVKALFVGFVNPLKWLLSEARQEQVGELRLVVGELPGDPERGLAVGLSGFGASFGSLPARVAETLRPYGLRAVAVVGSAGGIARTGRRFSWVAPDRVALAGTEGAPLSPVLRFSNLAAELPLEPVARGGLHVSVYSPLVETCGWVRALREAGAASVDCEVQPLVAAADSWRPRPALFVLLNLTDFPRASLSEPAEGSISGENSPEQYQRTTEALRRVVERLATLR